MGLLGGESEPGTATVQAVFVWRAIPHKGSPPQSLANPHEHCSRHPNCCFGMCQQFWRQAQQALAQHRNQLERQPHEMMKCQASPTSSPVSRVTYQIRRPVATATISCKCRLNLPIIFNPLSSWKRGSVQHNPNPSASPRWLYSYN